MASRSGRLPGPIDGVTPGLEDPVEAETDARAALDLGFTGKLCIHPRQVAAVHRGLAPTKRKVEWARTILTAAGAGAGRAGGEMVDPPVRARARSIMGRPNSDE